MLGHLGIGRIQLRLIKARVVYPTFEIILDSICKVTPFSA